jgi:competence protein ComEC
VKIGTRDLRLVPAAVFAWVVAAVAVGIRDNEPVLGLVCVALWLGAGVTVTLARGARSWSATVALGLIAGAIVLSAVVLAAPGREPPDMLAAAHSSRTVPLSVAVTGPPVAGRLRGTVGGVPVLIFGQPGDAAVGGAAIGDVLEVSGSLRRSDAGEDVAFLVFARGPAQHVASAGGAVAAAGALRARFTALVSDLPGLGAGLLPGLAIGDTTAVDPGLDSDMKTASLSHLTAVSGSNCAIVVGLVFAVAAGAGVPRWGRVAVASAALAGFVLLVTPQPSVLRAAVMAGIALAALALSRPGRGIPLLCAAVIVLLVTDPWLSRSYGFVLSVLATAGLLCLALPIAQAFARVLPRGVAFLVAVPFAAQLACQPVLLMLDPALPVYGVVANVLAEPAAPLATVAGLASCLLTPIAPGVATAIAWVAWVPSSWIAAVATFTAGLPGARSPWPTGPLGVGLLIVISVALIMLLVGAGPPRVRVLLRGGLVIALIAYTGTVAGGKIAVELGRPGDWEFALCDIGQGDAAVVRSRGQIAVIDTGPKPARLATCLDQLGIDRIQLLVLTHYDLDHVGGVDAVIGRVDRALIGPPSDPGDARIAGALRNAGAEVDQVSRGEHGALGDLDWQVVWPPPSGVEPGNPASVTILVTPARCDCLSGLFLGDLGEESQVRLLAAAHPAHVDVVKVAHHGSADQAPQLYEAIQATVGLIGVGADNTYGHPTRKLLDVLTAVGTAALRSDLDGLILVAPAGDGRVRVWTERGG